MTPAVKSAIANAIDGAVKAASGDYVGAADSFVRGGLDLVPWTVLQQRITDEQARRENAIAVDMENDKFGLEKPELDE